MKRNAPVDPQLTRPQAWLLPLIGAAGALAMLLPHSNVELFLFLNRLGPATNDQFWTHITVLGDTVVALALCLPLARRRPDLLWAVVLVALLATAWVHVLKPLFDATRPVGVLAAEAFNIIGPAHRYHSFPSGHSTTAFTLAGVCVLGFGLRTWTLLAVALAALVALSRVVVGVHWPLDIFAGVVGGWLAAVLGMKIAARVPQGRYPAVQWLATLAFGGCAVALIAGYSTGYADALPFQRALGLLCLAAFGLTFVPTRAGASGR